MRSQRGTLVVACLATAVLMLDVAVVNTALPHIAADLDAGLGGLQWTVDAYALALATIVLTAGSVADRIGRRRVFATGVGVFTLASIACGLAGSIVALDVARAVQGIGGAIMFATSLALLADAFPDKQQRVGALAAYGATIGASFALGPLVGGALTTGFGWQAVFFVNVPIGIAALIGTARWVRESRDPNARGLDWPGLVSLSGGLFLLVLALLRGNEEGWASATILAELGGAAVLLVAFVVIESRVASPMLPLELFRRADFTGAQVAAFAISGSLFAIFLYTTIYLQSVLGLSALEAGLVYLPGTVVLFLVSGASAQFGNRVAPGLPIAGGLLLNGLGLGLMTVAGADSSWAAILPGVVVACIGAGLLNPALSAVALSSAPQEQSGLAAGVNDTFRQAGVAVGVAAYGAMIPAGSIFDGTGSAADYVDGMHTALWVGLVLSLAGAGLTARLVGLGRAPAVAEAAA